MVATRAQQMDQQFFLAVPKVLCHFFDVGLWAVGSKLDYETAKNPWHFEGWTWRFLVNVKRHGQKLFFLRKLESPHLLLGMRSACFMSNPTYCRYIHAYHNCKISIHMDINTSKQTHAQGGTEMPAM